MEDDDDDDDEHEPIVGQENGSETFVHHQHGDELMVGQEDHKLYAHRQDNDKNKEARQTPFHHEDNDRNNKGTQHHTTKEPRTALLSSYVVHQSMEECITHCQSTTTTMTALPIHGVHHDHTCHSHNDHQNASPQDNVSDIDKQVLLSKLTKKILHNQQLQNTIQEQDEQLETLQTDYHATHKASQERERTLQDQVQHLRQLLASAEEAKKCLGEQFLRRAHCHQQELAQAQQQAQQMANRQAAQEQEWHKQAQQLECQLHQSKDRVQQLERQLVMAKEEEKKRTADMQQQVAKSESEQKQMTAKLQEAQKKVLWWQNRETELKKDLRKEQDYARQDRADRKRIQREMEDLRAETDQEKWNMEERLERAWAREAKLEKDWRRDKEQARNDYDELKQVQRDLESKVSRYQKENQCLKLQLQAAQQSIEDNTRKAGVEAKAQFEVVPNSSKTQHEHQSTLELNNRFTISLAATFRVGAKQKKHSPQSLHCKTLQLLHETDPSLIVHSRVGSQPIDLCNFPLDETAFSQAFETHENKAREEITVTHIVTSRMKLSTLKWYNKPLVQHLKDNNICLNETLTDLSVLLEVAALVDLCKY